MSEGIGNAEGSGVLSGLTNLVGTAAQGFFSYKSNMADAKAAVAAASTLGAAQAAQTASRGDMVKFAIAATILGVTIALIMKRA